MLSNCSGPTLYSIFPVLYILGIAIDQNVAHHIQYAIKLSQPCAKVYSFGVSF